MPLTTKSIISPNFSPVYFTPAGRAFSAARVGATEALRGGAVAAARDRSYEGGARWGLRWRHAEDFGGGGGSRQELWRQRCGGGTRWGLWRRRAEWSSPAAAAAGAAEATRGEEFDGDGAQELRRLHASAAAAEAARSGNFSGDGARRERKRHVGAAAARRCGHDDAQVRPQRQHGECSHGGA